MSERVFKPGDGEAKTRRGHIAADTILTCVAAAVCRTGGYIVVRVGAKVAISNVQASSDNQLNCTLNIIYLARVPRKYSDGLSGAQMFFRR